MTASIEANFVKLKLLRSCDIIAGRTHARERVARDDSKSFATLQCSAIPYINYGNCGDLKRIARADVVLYCMYALACPVCMLPHSMRASQYLSKLAFMPVPFLATQLEKARFICFSIAMSDGLLVC